MTIFDCSRLIDLAINLGLWPRVDHDLLVEQIKAWHDVLEPVPYDFAERVVRAQTRSIRPTVIRGQWDDAEKPSMAAYDDRACPWAHRCRCPHTNGCYRGWLGYGEDREEVHRFVGVTRHGEPIVRSSLATRWCPACWDARNTVRMDKGLEPLPFGQIGR